MIGIVDYGMGNLRSVQNALDYLGIRSEIVTDPNQLRKSEKIILPGVGAFPDGMKNLKLKNLDEAIIEHVSDEKPILGICLGMQLLFSKSYEHGENEGLGVLCGEVFHLSKMGEAFFVPHMGWNAILPYKNSSLLKEINEKDTFYFVHSYYCRPDDDQVILAETCYRKKFVSMCEYKNIFCCQFHPEKSQAAGLQLLSNFGAL